jgi:MFS family permease
VTPVPHWRRQAPYLTLALLAAIQTCGFIDRILMNVLAQPIKLEFGLTDFQVGLVAGLAFAALNALLGIWVARWAERNARIGLIALGTFLWSIATAACGLASSFVTLLLARIGVGVGEAVGLPATHSAVSDCFPKEKRATAMSVMLLAPPIGAFLGSAAGGLIAHAWGWRYAFWVAAVPGAILALLLMLLVTEPARGRFDNLGTKADEVPPLTAVLARIWQRRSLRHLLIGTTVASAVGFGLNAFMAAYLTRRYGFDFAQAGVAAGLLTSVPSITGVWGAGWLTDRLGRKDGRWYALLPGLALFAAAPLYVLAVTRDTAAGAIALLAASALVQYCYLGPTAGVFQNMMHPRMRASAAAVTTLVYSLVAGAIGPLLVGGLSDRFAPDATSSGSATGRMWAMAAVALGYIWGGLHLVWASRSLHEELKLPTA